VPSHAFHAHREYAGGTLPSEDMTHGLDTLGVHLPIIRDAAFREVRKSFTRGVRTFNLAGHRRAAMSAS
jgi:hypothetical protein